MRYAIYGVNRVSKDFMYVFDYYEDIEVVCFFEDERKENGTFLNKPVYKIGELTLHVKDYDKIIICDYTYEDKETLLRKIGLKYGEDYIYVENLFKKLDELEFNSEDRKIAIWGTGRCAERLLEWNRNISIDFYIDSFKEGIFRGKKIVSPEIGINEDPFIIVAIRKCDEIIEYLKTKGLLYGKDFCTDEEYKARPSELIKQTIFDKHCYDLSCKTMLNHMEVGTDGIAICCCSTFIHHSLGKITDQSPNRLWNSAIHKILCLSNVNRTYSFCRKDMCPLFIGRKDCEKVDINEPYEKMSENPTTVAVGFDGTCNLKCITCRKDYYIAGREEQCKLNRIKDVILNNILPYCDFYISAGNGETFMGKQYLELLDNTKKVKWIRLLTNGLLFNEKNWNRLVNNTNARIMMTVSIDAASADTYRKIRGGDFKVLKKNMEYAAELRKTGELTYLRFNFVVQRENYLEIPEFIKWGKELNVDEVFFTKILNWGTYSSDEFENISMMEEDGVTPKDDLKKILQLPIINDNIVDMGTIQFGREKIPEDIIDNYYRWELERKVKGIFK